MFAGMTCVRPLIDSDWACWPVVLTGGTSGKSRSVSSCAYRQLLPPSDDVMYAAHTMTAKHLFNLGNAFAQLN